jgi:hypothetical protein
MQSAFRNGNDIRGRARGKRFPFRSAASWRSLALARQFRSRQGATDAASNKASSQGQKTESALCQEKVVDRAQQTLEVLRKIGSRRNVMQIVPPRHVYRSSHVRPEEEESGDHELMSGALKSPTGPGAPTGLEIEPAARSLSRVSRTSISVHSGAATVAFREGFSRSIVENGYLDPLKQLGYGTGSGSYLGSVDG